MNKRSEDQHIKYSFGPVGGIKHVVRLHRQRQTMTRLRSCELSLGVGVRTGMGAADLTQSFLESLSLRPRARSHIDAAEMIRLIC